ncbi:hypothetical protein LB465_13625 [Salegentibacter sp. LM13S]|uniref:hypothetical protein n=1 Tax=Salegentibacter lacus TaxID=2873599 RepID=UPI001CCE4740|nr:hypothetical protein [Salegentibacter lacus]MBZ9631823.1 hypothetical protein [Salegentibacter lacus]
MMLRKPSEVDHLEKYYIANYTSAIYYKHCILTTKKIFLKKLFKSLYNHKKALKDDLDRHILDAKDQEYLEDLLLKCKKEVLKMHQNLSMNTNPKSGQICTEMENRFFKQLYQTLQLLTDGSLRNTLLSHKHQSKALQEKLNLVSKYLI